MENFTSKVKSVTGNGTWNGKDGTLFYNYDYEFENGNVVTASHVTETPKFAVGISCSVSNLKTNDYGTRGKIEEEGKEFKKGGSAQGKSGDWETKEERAFKQKSILLQVCIKEASGLYLNGDYANLSEITDKPTESTTQIVMLLAKGLYEEASKILG